MENSSQKTPRFSIVIPTTGRAELVKMSLSSLLAQTFRDFDVWIVDSGYADALRDYVESLADKRIHLVHPPDKEPFSTWNYGAHVATGDYVMWLDDDNYLLPFTLELFNEAARKSGAEVLTGSHVYYYDHAHPRTYLRNSLGILPYSGRASWIDLRAFITSLFAFGRKGPGSHFPRFHFSATVISREVVERTLARSGRVTFTDMPNMHAMQPILFADVPSCLFVDHPVVLIGRLGVSMGQAWSTAARDRLAKIGFVFSRSPVRGNARINCILESLLRAQELVPALRDIPISYGRFLELYTKELAYLDAPIKELVRDWRELFIFIETLPEKERTALRANARRLRALAPLIYLSRRTRLHYLWRKLYGAFVSKNETVRTVKKSDEYAVPIKNHPEITSVLTLAPHVRELLRAETGKDLFEWKLSIAEIAENKPR